MRRRKDTILIIVLVVLLLIALFIIGYLLINNTQNEEVNYKEIKGTVIVATKDYVIIETTEGDYLVNNIKGLYEVLDEVKFQYKETDINNESSPKTIKVCDEELIKRNIKDNQGEDNTINEDNDNISNQGTVNNEEKDNNSSEKDNNSYQDNTYSESADTAVLNYFQEYDDNIKSGKITDSLKFGFVTIVDFLFYKGTIKGYTFNDLTSSAKLKILEMALYFDNKIEEYFPGYKESISNTTNKVYTTVKKEVISLYLTITTNICTNNSELCENAKKGFSEVKKNFNLTWELLKDIAGDGLTNLKNWYLIWKES